ncbi:MAG: hypothetical protein JXN63_06395 [Candidatus Delongbacteria bacterium]|nr:hypothetical protein [Candidatus Delongbacteria bacterium]
MIFWILIFSSLVFCSDFNLEVNGGYMVEDFYDLNESVYSHGKLGYSYGTDNIFTEAVLYYDSRKDSDVVDVYRAFASLYGKNTALTLGRQKLVWGTSYIFNYADVFNEINIIDPQGEKRGVNSLDIKYSLGRTFRLEGAVYQKENEDIKKAARTIFNLPDWEFSANYFDTDDEAVFEAKGNALIGLWTQYVLKAERAVLGADYSFLINGNILYAVAEADVSAVDGTGRFYGSLRYNIDEFNMIQTGFMTPFEHKYHFFIANYERIVNDYAVLGLSYYRTVSKLFETDTAKIELKVNF